MSPRPALSGFNFPAQSSLERYPDGFPSPLSKGGSPPLATEEDLMEDSPSNRDLLISLAPPVLYIRGAIPAGPAVAVVGSRRADAYGREVADLFSRSLAAAGVAVISGFARGVDAAAHRGALAAGGPTVAVLGCGLGID